MINYKNIQIFNQNKRSIDRFDKNDDECEMVSACSYNVFAEMFRFMKFKIDVFL